MKILVTGGAGFIGSHIVDALVKKRHEVVVIDNLSSGKKDYINPKASFYKMDIRFKNLKNVFRKEKFDIVFHQAGQKKLRYSVDHPIEDADINIMGTLNLLEASRMHGVKKFIFASTAALYSEKGTLPYKETDIIDTASPYGLSKLTSEKYLEIYEKLHGLSYVALRYSNVYGPRLDAQGDSAAIAIFIDNLMKGKKVTIFGNGKQTRDFIYVDDVVEANLAAMKLKGSDIINVSTGKEISMNDTYDIIAKELEVTKRAEYASAKAGDAMRSALSSTKAKRKLGWKAKVDVKTGLKQTVEWFQNK